MANSNYTIIHSNALMSLARRLRRAALAFMCLLFVHPPVFGQTEIIEGKNEVMDALASMPYTSNGSGPVLYILGQSESPALQALERDWKDQLDGLEVRRILFGVGGKSSNDSAYLAQSRKIEDFFSIINGTLVTPDVTKSNTSIRAYNSVVAPVKNIIIPTLTKNGWPHRGVVSPQLFWETEGRLYARAGYTKESANAIFTLLRSKTQITQATTPVTSKPEGKIGPTVQSGPDVLGLRIGMTVAEAQQKIKPLGFASGRPPNQYAESSETLAFQLPGSPLQPIPNATYFKAISAFKREFQGTKILSQHGLSVSFSPIPGREEVAWLKRTVGIAPDERPTHAAFRKVVLEKYGTPTYSPSSHPGQYYWSYDSNGTLRSPGSISPGEISTCMQMLNIPERNSDWIFQLLEQLPSPVEKLSSQCGSIFIGMTQVILGRGPDSQDGTKVANLLISDYETRMIGVDVSIRGLKTARSIIDKAESAATNTLIKRGQGKSPTL